MIENEDFEKDEDSDGEFSVSPELPEHSDESYVRALDSVKPIAFSRFENIDGIDYHVISTGISGANQGDDIKFTARAVEKINETKIKENLDDDYFVRIKAGTSINSGLRYYLKFTTEFDENDLFFKLDSLDFATDRKSIFFILGHEIDYVEKEDQSGFTFKNIVKKMTNSFFSPE